MKIYSLLIVIPALAIPLAAQSNPLSAGNKGFYTVVKNNVIKAAEKMPEANYSFKPTDSVRSFGQLVGHVADAQYLSTLRRNPSSLVGSFCCTICATDTEVACRSPQPGSS